MSYAAYLRSGVLIALFAVLLVPFVVGDGGAAWGARPFSYLPFANTFFPFITGKHFIFRTLVEVALVLYVLLALKRPEYRPRASHLLWALGGLVAWMALSTGLSLDPVKSFWSNFERMEGYVSLLHLFAYFVIAGAVLSADKLWDRFLATTVGASAYMGLLALFQIVGWLPISSQSGARADTTFGNAAYLAVYLLAHFFITLYLLSRGRVSGGAQIFYGIALVLQALGIYYTQTRGAFLGLIAGLVVMALYVAVMGRGDREHAGARRWAAGALAGIVVLAGAFFALRDTPAVQSFDTLRRLSEISLDDATTRSRLFYIWPMAVMGGLERPLTGWGLENFSYIFNERYHPDMWGQESWFDRAHNQFLDWLVAGGVPAFLLYVSLYLLAVLAIARSTLPLLAQAALMGLLAAYAANNMFVFDNLGSAIFFFTLLAFLHGLSARELPSRLALTRPLSDHALAIAAPLVLLCVLLLGWSANGPAFARAKLLASAVGAPPPQALDAYGAALGPAAWPGNPLGRQETTEQLLQFTSALASSPDVDPALLERAEKMTEQAGEALLAQRQNDARLELFMSSFFGVTGHTGEALEYARDAAAHSPKKQQILFQLAALQLRGGDPEGGLATYERAWRLAPAYDHALIMYAGGFYHLRRTGEGDALLRERWGDVVVDNDQLLLIYQSTQQFDRAAAIWRMRIEKDPENMDLRVRLAETYLRAGDKDKAIEALREIAALRPMLAAQVEQLIAQIRSGLLGL